MTIYYFQVPNTKMLIRAPNSLLDINYSRRRKENATKRKAIVSL